LPGQPFGKVFFVERNHAETHDGVILAAEFRALAPEIAGFVGLQPDVVSAVGDHVDLAGEFWHPEAVDYIGGAKIDAHRTFGGNDEFVSGDEIAGAVERILGYSKRNHHCSAVALTS
jgi:hypothetical protein